jgi:hypothetical protein
MHAEPARQLRHRLFALQRFQRHLRLEFRLVLLPLRHCWSPPVGDQQTRIRSLRHCPAIGERLYEFGAKIGIAATNREGFILAAKAFEETPYDGHTLKATVAQSVRTGGVDPERIYVNRGYRGHDYDGDAQVIIAGQKIGLTPTMRREQKRRNGLEAVIGHAKFDHRMDRNYLLGVVGDAINALAATCGYNLRRILDAIRRLCALVILMFITGTAKFDTWTAPTSNLRSTA